MVSFLSFSLELFLSLLSAFSFEFFLSLDLLFWVFSPFICSFGFLGLSQSEIKKFGWPNDFSRLFDFFVFFSLYRFCLSRIFKCLLPSKFLDSFFFEQLFTEDFFREFSVLSFRPPSLKSSFSTGRWGLEWNSSSLLVRTLYSVLILFFFFFETPWRLFLFANFFSERFYEEGLLSWDLDHLDSPSIWI